MRNLKYPLILFFLLTASKKACSQRSVEFLRDTVIVGTAMNGHSSAHVWTKTGGVYFIRSKEKWEEHEIGKKVKLKGKLYLDRIKSTDDSRIINDVPEMLVVNPYKIKVVSLWRTKLYRELVPKEHR